MAAALDLQGLSYSAQYDELFAHPPLNTRLRLPKPSLKAQSKEPEAHLIPYSDVWAVQKLNNWISREPWTFTDAVVGVFISGKHARCKAKYKKIVVFGAVFMAIGSRIALQPLIRWLGMDAYHSLCSGGTPLA